ncbi:MAG: [FeFe] hydrogenase H-cluster radical SAM maturase HydE [Elusimicrobia bacterium]|nr:[FeFe] hydrogenase H-cluster radical SAM maturase HydE [Elusimicrobiota bacterium]
MSRAECLINKLCGRGSLSKKELAYLLSRRISAGDERLLFRRADSLRGSHAGDGIIVRGIVEFSNICRNRCVYCGLNSGNVRLRRYCMTTEDILVCARTIYKSGIRSIVLQSGESASIRAEWLAEVIKRIKKLYPAAITISAGERSRSDYALWKKAGADRYLLKIETTCADLYRRLHPGMKLKTRLLCLRALKELGYQTGSGCITGLPGQTAESIAEDLLFFRRFGMGMISIGPFIPHPRTPLSACAPADTVSVLRAIALARLLNPCAHIPVTTALRRSSAREAYKALECGANVVMFSFTPAVFRRLYDLYPGRSKARFDAGRELDGLRAYAARTDRKLDFSRGDFNPLAQKSPVFKTGKFH